MARAQRAGMLEFARHAEHAEKYRYERHRPEETVLYRVVKEYWSSFCERVEELGSLPKFVVNEVDEYVRCCILEYGFIRAICESCGFDAGGEYLWKEFCNSISNSDDRRECWKRMLESEQNKRGWCNWKFGN